MTPEQMAIHYTLDDCKRNCIDAAKLLDRTGEGALADFIRTYIIKSESDNTALREQLKDLEEEAAKWKAEAEQRWLDEPEPSLTEEGRRKLEPLPTKEAANE